MKTAAEKRRILSMPTVRGELKIKGETYKFNCIRESNTGPMKNHCVMINRPYPSSYTGDQAHILADEKEVEVWLTGFAHGYLQQFFKYSEIEILWCTYQGIPMELQTEQKQAA